MLRLFTAVQEQTEPHQFSLEFFVIHVTACTAHQTRFNSGTNEEQGKKLVFDVIDACATHACLLHDVRHTNCQHKNGSTHDHVFETFKPTFVTNLTKFPEKLLCRSC